MFFRGINLLVYLLISVYHAFKYVSACLQEQKLKGPYVFFCFSAGAMHFRACNFLSAESYLRGFLRFTYSKGISIKQIRSTSYPGPS